MKQSPFKESRFFLRLLKSLGNSFKGLKYLMHKERAFQQEALLFLVTLPYCYFLHQEYIYRLVFIAVLILIVEAINTAIELVCDEVTLEFSSNIAAAKDVASAAVFLLLIFYCGNIVFTMFL